jgi:hypothetical protein
MAEEKQKQPSVDPFTIDPRLEGGLYLDQTCNLCGRVWQRSMGLPPDPVCFGHTDADWQAWAAAQQPPVDPNNIARWNDGGTIPPPPS